MGARTVAQIYALLFRNAEASVFSLPNPRLSPTRGVAFVYRIATQPGGELGKLLEHPLGSFAFETASSLASWYMKSGTMVLTVRPTI
jgi:hypothetical protein